MLSCVRLLATSRTAAYQAPPSMGFSGQQYWSGVPLPSPIQEQSCIPLFVTPWTAACQAPLSMGFSKQEYWSGLPFLSPGELPNPGTKPGSPALAGGFFTTEPPRSPSAIYCLINQNSLKAVFLYVHGETNGDSRHSRILQCPLRHRK